MILLHHFICFLNYCMHLLVFLHHSKAVSGIVCSYGINKLLHRFGQISLTRSSATAEIAWVITPVKVIDIGTNWKPVCDFLLVINTNFHPISHRFPSYCTRLPLFWNFWKPGMSGNSAKVGKGTKSAKSRGICIVRDIWLWHLGIIPVMCMDTCSERHMAYLYFIRTLMCFVCLMFSVLSWL